jgi:hypothetical protein
MTKGKKAAPTQEDALMALAGSLKITDEDVKEAQRTTINLRKAVIEVPGELRLGQAIINGLGLLHKNNPTIAENLETALYYVTDSELQKAINEFHKPYGFGHDK